MHQEITVKNYRRSRKFGWGYTFTPTGEDAYSIEIPTHPDYIGTLGQIDEARANDRTWQSKGGAFYNTAWFYDGRRIVATWVFTLLDEAEDLPEPSFSPTPEYDRQWQDWKAQNEEHHWQNDRYGYGWVPGFHPGTQGEDDVKIRVEVQILTIQDIAREFSVTTRRARALAKHRHEKHGIGQQLPSGQWVFRPDDLDILRPDPKYRA